MNLAPSWSVCQRQLKRAPYLLYDKLFKDELEREKKKAIKK